MNERTELTTEQIREDNPHFGPQIRLIEEGRYKSPNGFDFNWFRTVGAYDSIIDFSLTGDGSNIRVVDAHATYLWSPSKNAWVLGAN